MNIFKVLLPLLMCRWEIVFWQPNEIVRGPEYGTSLGIGLHWKVFCFSPFSTGSHGGSEALQNAALLPCSAIPGDSPKCTVKLSFTAV